MKNPRLAVLLVTIAFALTYAEADNIQPVYVSHNESFTDVNIIVYNKTGSIYMDETFLTSDARTTAVLILRDINSSYDDVFNYSVQVNISGTWTWLDDLNHTEGYLGRGNLSALDEYLPLDGSKAMTGNLDLGDHNISNVVHLNPTAGLLNLTENLSMGYGLATSFCFRDPEMATLGENAALANAFGFYNQYSNVYLGVAAGPALYANFDSTNPFRIGVSGTVPVEIYGTEEALGGKRLTINVTADGIPDYMASGGWHNFTDDNITTDNTVVANQFCDLDGQCWIASTPINKTFSFVISDPAAGDIYPLRWAIQDYTVTQILGITTGSSEPEAVAGIWECDADCGSCSVIDNHWTISDTQYSDTSFTNPSVDSGDCIKVNVSSTSGTVDALTIQMSRVWT